MSTTRNHQLAIMAVIAAAIGSLALYQASHGADFYVTPGGKGGAEVRAMKSAPPLLDGYHGGLGGGRYCGR